MKNELFELISATPEMISALVSRREGELKLGEKVGFPQNPGVARYVVLGISEDFGPQANGGRTGSTTAYQAFLTRFLNMQDNEFQQGADYLIWGEIKPLIPYNKDTTQTIIAELDAFVSMVLEPLVASGLIPIVIGGGHNNAYPLMAVCSRHQQKPIAVVNCDAHADFRKCDYRHSGNPFSWAHQEGYLDQYAVLGLHQAYNNQYILDQLRENAFFHSFFEDYIREPQQWIADLKRVQTDLFGRHYGIELDLDAIAGMPSSAQSPSGLTLEQARQYVMRFAAGSAVYLHLPEAAPQSDAEKLLVGKALALLVTDFVKQNKSKT